MGSANGGASGISRDQIVESICDRIIGGESIAAIFRTPRPWYPDCTTFWRWLAKDAELSRLVGNAEIAACNALADRIIDIAHECRLGEIVTEGTKGKTKGFERKTVDMVERSKLEVHALQWTLARRLPKRFGDRTILAGDADNPVIVDDPKGALLRGIVPHVADAGTGEADR